MKITSLLMLSCLGVSAAPEVPIPKALDPDLRLQLFAAEPNIVTPVGIAIDKDHRIFVVESHTHFPKANYPGPKTDLVKMFVDADKDGKFDNVTIFADGFKSSMNLAFSPKGELYLVHRNGVVILRDRNGDGRSDEQKTIVQMDTRGNYPHNGLGGVAFSEDGWLYLGTGENLGEDYTLKGSDGSSHRGGGEGGNVFRCRPDGSKLQHVATGFWNAFALEFNGAGHLFCVDNDPDSRPPCRLIDVVQGGDYGYRFRYGRSGLHPFTAWNGELPGTLPMVAGTGEAPSGILYCNNVKLPAKYIGGLLVTSWGDHRLEFYRPKYSRPVSATLTAEREIILQGDEWFRPVALAAAPDGSIYFTDWVDRDYSVHNKGRIWRLVSDAKKYDIARKPHAGRLRMLRLLEADSKRDWSELTHALAATDPFIRSAAVTALSKNVFRTDVLNALEHSNAAVRLGMLLALRRAHYTNEIPLLERALQDPDEDVRLAAVLWAGEEYVHAVAASLPRALRGSVRPELLRAYTAAAERLGKSKDKAVAQPLLTDVMLFAVTNTTALSHFPPAKRRPSKNPKPNSDSEWRKALTAPGDAVVGRQLFFDASVGCAQCHRIEDHGGQPGPDLSVIGRVANRDRIIDSILEPSKEIAPQFVQHTVATKSGDEYSGILVGQQTDGTYTLLMNDGRGVVVPGALVATHETSKVSLMPDELEQGLTVEEFRDLLAFLLSLK
jgi:putative membrane-bound dehydrogenase-like protein